MKGADIQNFVFSFGFFGYKKSDIKAFLRELSEYVLKLENKVYELEVEKNKLESENKKTKIDERKFAEIMNYAHGVKDEMVKKAKEQAEEIINNARKKHEEVVKKIKVEKLKLEVMKREVDMVRKTILEKLDGYVKMIEMKEKNLSSNEESEPINYEINIPVTNKENKKFDQNSLISIYGESESRNEGETLEFNTKKNKNSIDIDTKKYDVDSLDPYKDHIKDKFREIDLR